MPLIYSQKRKDIDKIRLLVLLKASSRDDIPVYAPNCDCIRGHKGPPFIEHTL